LRHQELLAESAEIRRRAAWMRLRRAARLDRRSDDRRRRAIEIVEQTHQ
jgi:hypothetical protein